MWLPKDERLILAGLYHHNKDGADEAYRTSDLARCFNAKYRKRPMPEYGNPDAGKYFDDQGDELQQAKAYIRDDRRVRNATRQLAARGLITLVQHQHEPSVLVVNLTLPGSDLGSKYANWFDRTGLWFREYKDHWLWLLVAFIGGGIAGNLIDNFFDAKPSTQEVRPPAIANQPDEAPPIKPVP